MDPLDELLNGTGYDDVDSLLQSVGVSHDDQTTSMRRSRSSSQNIVPYSGSDAPTFPEEIYPKLENVIASCQLRVEIDLKKIAFRVRNAEYNPRKVNAVVVRFRTPRSTAMIYGQGKVMVTGARTELDALEAAKKASKIVMKCGYTSAVFSDFKVENLVASTDVRFPVRLEGVNMEHRSSTSYEPELFPGLVYRLFSPKVSILVFVSGKVVITGARTQTEVRQSFEKIYPVLWSHRR